MKDKSFDPFTTSSIRLNQVVMSSDYTQRCEGVMKKTLFY